MKAEKPTVQKRAFKAFADLAILVALKDRAMTGYGINNYFMNKVGDEANPSTIYSSLSSLERKGWIKCVRNRSGRAYGLTEEGRKIANNMNNTAEETKRFIDKLLKN
jgi:DNA-binding PadR family transcriptional regulator